ncbi:MAG: carboxypeptidase regulatory-like domain-containing protein [Acidobacteriota bacterium]
MKGLRTLKRLTSALIFMLVTTLVIPFNALSVMAQATTGALRGVVTDSSGAVVTDADVTARNTATGIETKTKSNSEGIYNFPRLAPGKYLLVVEKQGFKKQEFQEVTINLGQDLTIDASLQAGQVSETVTVTAQGEQLIQREQVQVSNSFESRKVAELPNNAAGGGIDTLALLAPGVVPGFGNVNANGTTLSVNGQRARSNNFTIDGQDNNDLSIGGPNFFLTNSDAVQEFSITTNNFSAEFGRNQGAIVNIATKSGTNDYHGTAAWFHRDQKLFDSMNNIERRTNNSGRGENDPLLDNVFSGTFGGPVKRERLFFFGSFQYHTTRSLGNLQAAVPTIAREELARLRADFPNNAAIQALANFSAFAITDLGTISERTDFSRTERVTIGGRSYRLAYPQRLVSFPADDPEWGARVDYKINDRHSVWYRHLYQTFDGTNGLAGSAGFTGDIPASGNIGGAQFTSQISNTAVNEARFLFNRLSVIFGGGCEGLKGCIPHPDQIGETFTRINFPGVASDAGNSLQAIGAATNLPQGRVVTIYQFSDNFSKSLGRHQIKMGADVRRLTNAVPFLPNVNGAFSFNNVSQLERNSPGSVNLAAGQVEIRYNETDQFYYFQDDWRVSDSLTLNLGVRYEYTGQPVNTLHDLSLERESNPQTALWRQNLPLEARTYPKLPADKNNWAPRLGFAWRPGLFKDSRLGKALFGEQDATVIRGGYSIAYDPGFYNIMLNISTSSPLVFFNTTVNPASGPAIFPVPSNSTGAGVQQFAQSNGLIALNRFDPRFFSQTIVAPDFHSPYAQNWSLGIQRQVNRSNVVEVRYVGAHAVGLFQTLNRNPLVSRLINGFTAGGFTFPGFPNLVPQGTTFQVAGQGSCVDDPATTTLNEAAQCNGRVLPQGLVRSRENTAQSIYHGLQTEYRGRMFNQLSIGMSYTFSKSLDNASEIFSFFESAGPQNPFDAKGERGFSGFDRPHAFAMNWIWDVPAYKDQKGIIGKVLGGWQLNGTYFLANGQRFTPSQVGNAFFVGNATYMDRIWERGFLGLDTLRPFYGNPDAPNTSVGISQIDAALIFGVAVADPNGFYSLNELDRNGRVVTVGKDDVRYIFNGAGAARIFGTPYGDVIRGAEQGPRLNNLNLGMAKNTQVTERVRLQFRVDMFNALNHPNPGVGFNAGGRTGNIFVEGISAAGTSFNDNGEIAFARRAMQFSLKVIF